MFLESKPIGGGVTRFTHLEDAPGSLAEYALQAVRVNEFGTALEFYQPTDTLCPIGADVEDVRSWGAAGTKVTTTLYATCSAGSQQATLTDASTFEISNGMAIPGAGVAGAELVVQITDKSGNVVTFTPATSTTVSGGQTVYHDDTVAIKAAIAAAKAARKKGAYAGCGDYPVLGGGQDTIEIDGVSQCLFGGGVDFRTLTHGTILWNRSLTKDVIRLKGENSKCTSLTVAMEAALSPTSGAAFVLGKMDMSGNAGNASYHLRLENVGARNTYDGVRTEYATGSWIDQVYVNSPRRYGFHFNSPAPTGGNWYSRLQCHLRGDAPWKANAVSAYYFENLDTSKFNHIVGTGFKSNIHYNANNNIPGYTWNGGQPGSFQHIWTNVNLEIPYDNVNHMVKIQGIYRVERIKFCGIEAESFYIGGSQTDDVGIVGFTVPWSYNGIGFEIYAKGTHISDGDVTMNPAYAIVGIKIGATAHGTRIDNVRTTGATVTPLEIIVGATDTQISNSNFSSGTPIIGTTTAEEMTIRNVSRFSESNIGLDSFGPSVSYTPGYRGQWALVAGIWYRAAGVSSTADWKALN